MDGTSNEMERAVYLVVREKLRDHLVQELRDASTTAQRGRLTPKELLTEAEKLLLRTGSGMSLLERLRRDGPLRAELQSLLKAIDSEAGGGEKRKRVTIQADTDMTEVPL